MSKEISKQFKILLLIHTILLLLFGVLLVFIIEIFVALSNWPFLDPIIGWEYGIAFLGLALINLLAYEETEWKAIEKIVYMHIFMLIASAILHAWGIIYYNLPANIWGYFALYAALAIAYIVLYLRERE